MHLAGKLSPLLSQKVSDFAMAAVLSQVQWQSILRIFAFLVSTSLQQQHALGDGVGAFAGGSGHFR